MHALGPLEARVMDVLWDAPDSRLCVHDVLQRLDSPQPLAYTTVKTVLDNLHRKGWADRERDRRLYRYQPVNTREAVAAQAVCELVGTLTDIDAFCVDLTRRASPGSIEALRRALDARP